MKQMDFLSVFRVPKPGTLTSAAPGTGPAQRDTPATSTPGILGGRPVPAIQTPDAVGYGGGADTVTIVKEPPSLPARGRIGTATGPLTHEAIRPRFNKLYDTLRTEDGWRHIIENVASGTITQPTGNAVASALVTLNNATNLRTSQFPGAIHVYPVILLFSFAPVTTTATGVQSWTFQPASGGYAVPLGVYGANGQAVETFEWVLDAPITDAGNTAMGTLYCTGNTIATPATVAWQIGFGWAYLLPDELARGYEYDRPLTWHEARSARTEATLRRTS